MIEPAPSPLVMDIQPMELYNRILRRWPWVFLVAVAGGVLGLVVAQLTPPTYRATAVADIGIDYGRSEWLDEDAERHVMNRVQAVLLADDTLQGALDRVVEGATDPSRSLLELRSRINLVRVEARWQLSVSDESPEVAAELANAWAESAVAAVDEAVGHGWRAAELQALFFDVSCRPEPIEDSDEPSLWVCDQADPAGSEGALLDDLLDEVELSRGLPPVISYSLSERAQIPQEPLYSLRAMLALAGTGLGLIGGTGLALAVPDRSGPDIRRGALMAGARASRSDPSDHPLRRGPSTGPDPLTTPPERDR